MLNRNDWVTYPQRYPPKPGCLHQITKHWTKGTKGLWTLRHMSGNANHTSSWGRRYLRGRTSAQSDSSCEDLGKPYWGLLSIKYPFSPSESGFSSILYCEVGQPGLSSRITALSLQKALTLSVLGREGDSGSHLFEMQNWGQLRILQIWILATWLKNGYRGSTGPCHSPVPHLCSSSRNT